VNALGGDDAVGVKGTRSNPFNLAAEINGGAGDDRLGGGGGADAINGGDGHDRVEGGDGADVLHGDAGNDRVDGGRGADRIFGDAGNDYLTAADRGEVDLLDGGTNDPVTGKSVITNPDGTTTRVRGNRGDEAVIDAIDTVTTVETTALAKVRKGAGGGTTTTTPPPTKTR
jgi:Ca2+-binding RTX toxin-like protein